MFMEQEESLSPMSMSPWFIVVLTGLLWCCIPLI